MAKEIEIASKFEPLFELLDDNNYPEVDTVILTGGRASSKSFSVALLVLIGVVERCWKALYSRFTNTSIGDSIKAEVSDKIELLNYERCTTDNKYSIDAESGGKIAFKGIKTGSKGQTANLKSLSGFNVFIVDEAEEIPSYEVFKKVFYSIRSVDKRNLSILILNPTTKEHWIYTTFFEKYSVPDGFCGVINNVMYIHSSYLDVNPKFIPDNIRKDYERLKEENPIEYDNVVGGGWITEPEGVLFKRSELQYYDELPDKEKLVAVFGFVDIADSGTDAHCVPIGYIYSDGCIYIDDVVYTTLGTDKNVDMTAEILNHHKPEFCRVEINMGGGMYPQLLTPKLNDSITILPIREKSNKETRIYVASGFIKRHFRFKRKYEHGSQYFEFMKILCSYMADGSSEHDDAPDGCTGIANMVKQFCSELYDVS